MHNILNARVRRLIKDDLLEYGKHLLGFLGFLIGFVIIVILLNGGIPNHFEGLTINIGDSIEFTTDDIGFSFPSFVVFIITMFIAGITAGYELPQSVRAGIARKEYFFATTVAALIVSLLIAPIMLTLNMVVNLFTTSGSLFYNVIYIGGGELSTLIKQFLVYIALFLFGFCFRVIWQRVKWRIGIIITSIFFSIFYGILGFIGWKIGSWLNIFTVTTGDAWFEISWSFSSGLLIGLAMVIIVISGIGTYVLISDMPVKMK